VCHSLMYVFTFRFECHVVLRDPAHTALKHLSAASVHPPLTPRPPKWTTAASARIVVSPV
jgi:hypothetical protein